VRVLLLLSFEELLLIVFQFLQLFPESFVFLCKLIVFLNVFNVLFYLRNWLRIVLGSRILL
jgi:hypothetical protein